MGDLSSFVEGIVGQLGRAFFLSGFIPMMIFIAVNQYGYFGPPSVAGPVFTLFPTLKDPWLGLFSGEMFTTVVIALVLAFFIMPLNTFIIKLFEGFGVKGLLFPLMLARQAQYKTLYAPIGAKRVERMAMLAHVEEGEEYNVEADFNIQAELDQLHSRKEAKDPVQMLPFNPKRLMPTMFGNAWAVLEEYPMARYGMDGMVFWPYVRVAMSKENPGLLEQVDGQKQLIDFVTHLALVMGVLALEGLVLAAVRLQLGLLGIALLALVLFWGFYQSGVSYVHNMGQLINQSFDLYRLKVLDMLDVARPGTLDEEYWVWTRLSAFLRRGEPFYFDMLDRAGK
jgi:hypothetical protein